MKYTDEAKALRRLKKRERTQATAMLMQALPKPSRIEDSDWSQIKHTIVADIFEAIGVYDLQPEWRCLPSPSGRARRGLIMQAVYRGDGPNYPGDERVQAAVMFYLYDEAGLWDERTRAPSIITVDQLITKAQKRWDTELGSIYGRIIGGGITK